VIAIAALLNWNLPRKPTSRDRKSASATPKSNRCIDGETISPPIPIWSRTNSDVIFR